MRSLAALGLAAGALALAVGTCVYTRAALRDVERTQRQLARELHALARPSEAAAVAPTPSAPVAVAPTPPADTGPRPEAAEQAPLEAVTPPAAEARDPFDPELRDGILDRYERLPAHARARAMKDLGVFARWGDWRATEALLASLEDRDPGVRKEAIDQLGKLADPALVDQLEPLVDDPDPGVRKALARSLGDLASPRSGEVLVRLLWDEDRNVVERALKAIGEIGYADARPGVARLVEADDLRLVGSAGRTLGQLGDLRGAELALERLAEAYASPDPGERRRVLKEARKIGGAPALALLERGLQDPDPKVRGEAKKGLDRLLR